MSPIIPSRYGHPKYNLFPQKSRAASLGGFKTNQRGTPGTDSKSRRKQRVEESKITVQPTEDEDSDNFFSKQLAAARFQRNHRLINVLFSDVVVEPEQPSDNDKIQACKKKIKTLSDYQKKIDDEIVEINQKFHAKKAKIAEESKSFAATLAELIANSKKDISVARAAQQEASLRQLARAALDDRQESAKRIKLDHKTTSDLPIDEQLRKDVRLVLDGLLESLAISI